MDFFGKREIQNLILINPDNPSGNYIPKKDLLKLAEWTKARGMKFLVDESFVDFAETEQSSTLLEQELLSAHPCLIVVKSISKSFGVPGLRLGVLASGDENLINVIKKDVAIWNINSFAEFYMQIFEKYRSEYDAAMKKFYGVRRNYIAGLRKIDFLRVVDSQANFILCEVKEPFSASVLTEELLDKYNILIKDLSSKKGFNGASYIRVAVKTPEENTALVSALKAIADRF